MTSNSLSFVNWLRPKRPLRVDGRPLFFRCEALGLIVSAKDGVMDESSAGSPVFANPASERDPGERSLSISGQPRL